MDLLDEWVNSVASKAFDVIYNAPPDVLQVAGIFVGGYAALFTAAYVLRNKRRGNRGPKKMTDQMVFKQRFSDVLTTAIEDGLNKGWWTNKEARRMYVRCADKFGLEDLKPKSLLAQKLHKYKAELLKLAIKARTNGGPTNVKPMPIPEPSNVVLLKPGVMRKKRVAA